MPFDLFLDSIQNGKWQDHVLPIRAMRSKEERTAAKKKVPYVTVSGVFRERNNKGLVEPSGFIAIDIDNVDPEETKSLLCADRYVYAAFTSISGMGLCVIFRIDPKKHSEAFEGLQQYLFTNYQLVVDSAARDLSRPRFISFDPHIYINVHAPKFTEYPKPIKALTKVPQVVYVQSDFESLVREICARRIDITGAYHQWLAIAYGLADKFGEGGRGYFHDISQFSHLYKHEAADRQYTECLKTSASNKRATIATVIYLAKQAGIQTISERTKLVTQTAALAKKGRRTKDDTIKLLQEVEGIKPAESSDIVEQVFANNISAPTEESPVEAIETWLRQNYEFRRNAITRYIEKDGRQMQAKDFNSVFISAAKVFDKCRFEIIDRIINSDFTPEYNPILDFFEVNKHRKPKGCIEALFNTIESDTGLADNEFFPDFKLHFGTKWLVGIISAAYGQHCPLMLVLAGEKQNTGKTEWFRRLLPSALKPYYAESKLDKDKDDEILMTQKLLILDDEMSGKMSKETTRLKMLTSKQIFSLREPYGRNNVDLQRLAVLCGTTNSKQILSDPTGNRRMLPINVLAINHAAYNSIDKTDLFMEAYHLYHAGFKTELSGEDVSVLSSNTGAFNLYSKEYELITTFFDLPTEKTMQLDIKKMNSSQLKDYIEKRSAQRFNDVKFSDELRRLGFTATPTCVNGIRGRYYSVILKEQATT